MNILMTCTRLDLLFKASPAGIVAVNRQTLAELKILALAGLLERDEEGIFRLTAAGRHCVGSNLQGAHPFRDASWKRERAGAFVPG